MKITEVLDAIQRSTDWFRLRFVKSDGSIVEHKCKTRIKHRGENGQVPQNSNFKYSLRDSYSILLDVEGSDRPRTIKCFAILGFQNCDNIIF
uniref:hypothetical protein n=1 Tax=Roseivirga sp. TaxID=1964215 RepID=UPI004048C63D